MAQAAPGEITVKLDDMGKQMLAKLATIGPVIEAAITHVRFPTPESMANLESAVNTYLRLVGDEPDVAG